MKAARARARIGARRSRARAPETPMHLDAILVDEDLIGGLEPRLGRAHLRTLTIMGFPSQTWPGLPGEAIPEGPPLAEGQRSRRSASASATDVSLGCRRLRFV